MPIVHQSRQKYHMLPKFAINCQKLPKVAFLGYIVVWGRLCPSFWEDLSFFVGNRLIKGGFNPFYWNGVIKGGFIPLSVQIFMFVCLSV